MCRSITTASEREAVGELDRLEAVLGGRDHAQLGLAVDQRAQRLEEELVVVCEENLDRSAVP